MRGIIGRFGGKSNLKIRIVDDYFIKDYENMTYVEPFVGGGSIFFYKKPSTKEIINDLDKDVVTVFKGVKKYSDDDIENAINGKYTKEEFKQIQDSKPNTEFKRFIKELLLYRLSFFSAKKSFGKGDINAKLDGYKERLKDVTILNEDYKSVIKKYDSSNTFFYLDPPYEESEGLYKDTETTINELFNILKNIKGKFLLSYNLSKEALELFKSFNIYKIKTVYQPTFDGSDDIKKKRNITELLISNY
jgi:DNA adenine methylase